MTTPNYSGFLTSFLNTGSTTPEGMLDILSSATQSSSAYTINNGPQQTMESYYFYLGNLLIQYCYVGQITPVPIPVNQFCKITFPIPYETIPTVLISPWNGNGPIGLNQITPTFFSVIPGTTNNNYPNWIAIGPRPPPITYTASGAYNVSSNSSYNTIITFTGNGTITFNGNYNINYIMVGAGGNGGGNSASVAPGGGGGGGGEVISSSYNFMGQQSYSINVADNNSSNTNITNNSGTVVLSCENGSSASNVPAGTGGSSGNGKSGGSGLNPALSNNFFGGGGGGNGGSGGSANASAGGVGGSGTASPIDGTIYGAGGNGGSTFTSSQSTSGAPNTGNGGVGGNANGIGGSGGSGVVVLYFNV